jgi:NAD(P)-dependent dehydrogenase (short-subunit alcohol dehydrogenase family)
MAKIVITGASGHLGKAFVECFRTAETWTLMKAFGEKFQIVGVDHHPVPAPAGEEKRVKLVGGVDLLTVRGDGEGNLPAELANANILIHCVGGYQGGPFEKTTDKMLDALLDVNVKSTFRITQAMLPHMKMSFGRIVYFSSALVGADPAPSKMSAYLASKAALEQMSSCIRAELPKNVKMTCFALNTLDTPSNRQAMPSADHSQWIKPEHVANDVMRMLVAPEHRRWQYALNRVRQSAPIVGHKKTSGIGNVV